MKLVAFMRGHSFTKSGCYRGSLFKANSLRMTQTTAGKNYNDPSKEQKEKGIQWYPLPIGAGIAWLVAYSSYKLYQKKTEDQDKPVWLNLYANLPWKWVSRQWGAMNSLELPVFLRSPLYGLYSSIFGCNLEEMDNQDLDSYRNLGEFFYRPLKETARIVDSGADLVSPSDGKVLHFGKVTGDRVEQIKGITYSLQNLLGTGFESNDQEKQKEISSFWRFFYPWSSSAKKQDSSLFFAVIYLAPGDYHRFHSPTNWSVDKLRHFSGELFSVSPFMVKALQDLFVLNERVVLLGKWKYGFFSMIPVGATNVGSIVINAEPELVTNQPGQLVTHPLGTYKEVVYQQEKSTTGLPLTKGEELGGFKLGSTVVLVFEAPSDFQFDLEQGQRVYMGQRLSK